MYPSLPDAGAASPASRLPPVHSAPRPPAPCGVPPFGPLRVRYGGVHRLRRALRRQRRAMAAGLALTAAAMAVSGLGDDGRTAAATGPPTEPVRQAVRLVSAPVRIMDAATVRLLRPGDRVDVIAADGAGSDARVVARNVRVADVPSPDSQGDPGSTGALVVLSVERKTAAALAGAGMTGTLAVAVSDER